MKYKKSLGERIFDKFNIILLSIIGFCAFYPFWYIFIISLNSGKDSARGGIYIWPRVFTFENIITVIKWDMFSNSLFISIMRVLIYVPLHLLITSSVAYAMSCRNFIARKVISIYMLITMLFGGGLIPYYLVLYNLRLINTFWVFIFPGLFSVWSMIVMRTSFYEIPESIIEISKIDGANDFLIYSRIMIPLSKPMLATLGLFAAVGQWNDWFGGAFFVTNKKLVPLQTFVQYMLMRGGAEDLITQAARMHVEKMAAGSIATTYTANSLKFTAVFLTCLPIIIIYPILQKYFVKGVMIGSIKE